MNEKTTIAITKLADDVLDAVIASMETPITRINKRGFSSEHLVRTLWDKVPADKKPALLKKYPDLRQIVGNK